MAIRQARKELKKLRIGLSGPSGSGKSYTGLRLGTAIVSSVGGRIVALDSENNSLSLYANKFPFDTFDEPWPDFSPATYVKRIREAERAGASVIIVDSLSHAWMGRGGALEMVDVETSRSKSGNSFTAWRKVTPEHNKLVDALIHCKAHVIATMRSKTDWVMQPGANGKLEPKKVGLQPVQREGLDYEFDFTADLDMENNLIVSKTRFSTLRRAVIHEPGEDLANMILEELRSGAHEAPERAESPAPDAEAGRPEPERSDAQHQLIRSLFTQLRLDVPGREAAFKGIVGRVPTIGQGLRSSEAETLIEALKKRLEERQEPVQISVAAAKSGKVLSQA